MTGKASPKGNWILAWALLCLLPLAFSFYALVGEANQALIQYRNCFNAQTKFLPVGDASICCMPSGLHHTIQHPEDQIITFSNETLIVMNAAHGGKAFLVFLFLTPSLLLGIGVLMNNQLILRVGAMSTLVTYLFILTYIIYAIATFTDS